MERLLSVRKKVGQRFTLNFNSFSKYFQMKKYSILSTLMLFFTLSAFAQHQYDAPWNQPPVGGLNFTVKGIDNVPDIYGDINNPQLVVFFAGNQFMCLDSLFTAFKRQYPQYTRIFAETLPPGILYQQIENGGITIGNMHIDLQPDVYTAGKNRMDIAASKMSKTATYAYNNLTIMVHKGNPLNIKTLNDLAKDNIRLTMLNPKWEGIAKQISKSLKNAGGDSLEDKIMKTKVADGTTYLTKIHHRESPIRIMASESDAGVVWSTEALYQKQLGQPIELIPIPNQQNVTATYMAGILKKAPHAQAAKDFFDFLQSPTAKKIYARYGFQVRN